MTLPLFADAAGAEFSRDRAYRFRLWRRWSPTRPACFCMLNPSTANETDLDPTLRRCAGFARSWGCGGLVVVNLFALVSPDPRVLVNHPDPVGRGNDEAIVQAARESAIVVVGWGACREARRRAFAVSTMLRDVGVRLLCLGTNGGGSPKHPLYLPHSTVLQEWGSA